MDEQEQQNNEQEVASTTEEDPQNVGQMGPTPLSPQPSHTKLIVGIVAVFVLVVVAGAYFVFHPKAQEEKAVTIEDTDLDISNWQTYRNEEYGFEFKYPKKLFGTSIVFKETVRATDFQGVSFQIFESRFSRHQQGSLPSKIRFTLEDMKNSYYKVKVHSLALSYNRLLYTPWTNRWTTVPDELFVEYTWEQMFDYLDSYIKSYKPETLNELPLITTDYEMTAYPTMTIANTGVGYPTILKEYTMFDAGRRYYLSFVYESYEDYTNDVNHQNMTKKEDGEAINVLINMIKTVKFF